jgi:hypothetical protein
MRLGHLHPAGIFKITVSKGLHGIVDEEVYM